MNCKLGDLALILSMPNRDRLVTVLDKVLCKPGEWRVRLMQTAKVYNKAGECYGEMQAGSVVCANDDELRPIRDPGDDAVDETLQWLPAPSKEVVA